MGAAECDVFAIYAEPRATTAERIAHFRARAAVHGRTVGFNMSVRPIVAPTEGEAWDKARHILAGMGGKLGWARQESEGVRAPVDNAGRRQFAFAEEIGRATSELQSLMRSAYAVFGTKQNNKNNSTMNK